ncbi:auxin-responsive protein IAA29-like isoform X2 [Malania oleifera]|uniref:auxin-responsive protein IAA29-like isoform X2 n=1 Tax=Malania oleifera TaxID=397392 RepID=UPI0025ADA7CC|nr:auxin-responsive protein IAA29-like isoform X2 [Malania oleifera]XP_057958110.1 auxin-responsive protein IAA29-like isoform X2 [Malania oleifera]
MEIEMKMELELGLALPTHNTDIIKNYSNNNKRGFEEVFVGEIQTRPLLQPWSTHRQPNEEDDDHKKQKKTASCPIYKNGKEEKGVVGWPPIKAWRKRQFFGLGDHHVQKKGTNEGGGSINNSSLFVKVKMEGVATTRKIDLTLHHSYQTLTRTLSTMFSTYEKNDHKDGACYRLIYQDKGGNWLIAGDVPWQNFMKSVQCLKIERIGV